MMRKHLFAAAASIFMVAVSGMPALAKDNTAHLRGTITDVQASQFQMKTEGGESKTVKLNDQSTISGIVDSSLDQIKKGTFIGTANVKHGGNNRALEVVVFPKSMAGRGLGDYPWDLSPSNVRGKHRDSKTSSNNDDLDLSGGSSMTNGTVTKTSDQSNLTVKVDYGDATKTITIPEDAPVVAVQKGSHEDLKPGAKVFVVADTSAEPAVGKLILVGVNGAVPPM